MKDYNTNTYGDKMADIYDKIQGERDADETARFIAGFVKGKVLELGIGTGRVAIPLAKRNFEVYGIDSSPLMLEQLNRKYNGNNIHSIIGDFASFDLKQKFSVIYAVFGTFFCLNSQEEQIECLKNVYKHLEPNGVFILECSIPDFRAYTRHQNVRMSHISIDEIIITVSEHDPVKQKTTSQHIVITEDSTKLMPVCVRYAWPSELDLMGQIAGLELKERWEDWNQSPFNKNSLRHISVYRKY